MHREHPGLRLIRPFGLVVREERERRGLSQEELARQTELSRAYVAALELGQKDPDLDVIEALANALDCPPEMLVKRAQELAESERRAASGEESIAADTGSSGVDAADPAD